MKTVLYVIARLSSTRIPKKNILDLNGIPMILRTINQLKKIKGIDELCLATTDMEIDDDLVTVVEAEGVRVYRGDAEYVLDRVYNAALEDSADIILYAGGDGPLIDHQIYTNALSFFKANDINFLTSYEPQTFPGGYDFNIIDFESLEYAFKNAVAPSQKINMFSYFSFNETHIKKHNFTNQNENLSHFHFSLDFPEDIPFFKLIFKLIDSQNMDITLANTLALVDSNGELKELCMSLYKPKVNNALFNSVHVMKGFFQDIEYLTKAFLSSTDDNEKKHLINQILNISKTISK
jgi:spore coat polysaccharide biosynthesis protein SpsF